MTKLLTRMLLVALYHLATPVWAETVIQCGEISGQSYYFPIGNAAGEWVDDKASGSKFSLVDNQGTFDIIFGDLLGLDSVTNQNGTLYFRGSEGGILMFIAEYETRLFEIWTFNLPAKEMILSQHRMVGLIPKVSIFKADCY